MTDKLIRAAKLLGREHGESMADSVERVGIDKDMAGKILGGYDEGDETVLDLCPKPLSGEWANDPTPMMVLDQIANKAGDLGSFRQEEIDVDGENLLDAYEESYQQGFWVKVIKACKRMAK